MIDGILQILQSIGDFFASIGGFIVDFFGDLVSFVQNLGSVSAQMTTLMGGLPAYFISGILALVVIMVLLRVLGRD